MSTLQHDPATAARTSWSRDASSTLRHAARDVVLVLLGAALAFAGESVRDARNRRAQANEALTSIREELQRNAGLIVRAQAHHRALVDTLEKLAAAHRVPDVGIYSNGMFNPAPVTSVAWQSARESGALGNLSLAVVLGIAPVYETQERYRSLADAMGAAILADARHDGMERVLRDRFAQFIPLDIDFANREGVLLEQYRRALQHARRP